MRKKSKKRERKSKTKKIEMICERKREDSESKREWKAY